MCVYVVRRTTVEHGSGHYMAIWLHSEHGYLQWDLGPDISVQALQIFMVHLLMLRDFACLQFLVCSNAIDAWLPEFEKFHVASLVQHKVAQCAVVSTSFLAEVWKSSQ